MKDLIIINAIYDLLTEDVNNTCQMLIDINYSDGIKILVIFNNFNKDLGFISNETQQLTIDSPFLEKLIADLIDAKNIEESLKLKDVIFNYILLEHLDQYLAYSKIY